MDFVIFIVLTNSTSTSFENQFTPKPDVTRKMILEVRLEKEISFYFKKYEFFFS